MAVELAHAPAAAQGFRLVKVPGRIAFHREQSDVGGPREREGGGKFPVAEAN